MPPGTAIGKRAYGREGRLAEAITAAHIAAMSFAELKDQVARLDVTERLDLAALITHLGQADDPQYQADLDQRLAAMDAGRKFGLAELDRIHNELAAKGK